MQTSRERNQQLMKKRGIDAKAGMTHQVIIDKYFVLEN